MAIQRAHIGIIGMGRMGQMYARLAQENAEAELVAICDTDAERRTTSERMYQVKGYVQSAELVHHPCLDAVFVTTPDFAHLDPVLQAAERGLHLLIEKPLATDLAEAAQMVDSVSKSQVVAMMAHVFRWSAPFVRAKTELDSGRLGVPLSMNMRIDDRIFVPTQMLQWARSTTPAWFLLSHAVDLACWYADSPPVQLYANGVKKKLVSMGIDTYDLVHVNLTFENQVVASLEACWTLPNSFPSMSGAWFSLISTEGGQYIDVQDQMLKHVGEQYEAPATLRVDMYGRLAGLQSFMFQSFLDSILRSSPVASTIDDGFRAVTVLEGVHRSLESGEVVCLGHDNCR